MSDQELLNVFNEEVWELGYYSMAENGVKYEMYLNEDVFEYNQELCEDDFDEVEGLVDIDLSSYHTYRQITFVLIDECAMEQIEEILI